MNLNHDICQTGNPRELILKLNPHDHNGEQNTRPKVKVTAQLNIRNRDIHEPSHASRSLQLALYLV